MSAQSPARPHTPRAPRQNWNQWLEVIDASSDGRFAACDLSVGGVSFMAPKNIGASMKQVFVHGRIRRGEPRFWALGEVVHKRESGDALRIGVRFTHLDEMQREALGAVLG